MADVQLQYQGITTLPRHIEEKLLGFNILQLCALVSERTGPRWSGASDRYGPIQEIERRWKLDELAKRIADLQPEEPLRTYARVMTAIGGNPSLNESRDPADLPVKTGAEKAMEERFKKIVERPYHKDKEPDFVALGLKDCLTLGDLKKVAKEQGLEPLDWAKIDGLKNFGLKRMYVGNKWRTKLRKGESNGK